MKRYLIIVMLAFGSLLYSAVELDGRYQLMISKGNNHFDSGEMDLALKAFKDAVKYRRQAPDAYLQIGHIHLVKDFHKIALDYFQQAEKYKDHFIYPESKIVLIVPVYLILRA